MRYIKHIVNGVVWSLLTLYILLLIMNHIPACQGYLGSKVAEAISEKLATRVTVGSIDLGFLNRVIINDVTLYDQQNRIMLVAARMAVKMDVLELIEGKIAISSAQLFGATGRFYKRNAQAKPNYQFVLDSLASKDTTSSSPLDLRINSLIIRRSGIIYDQSDIPRTDGLFNPHHLRVSNISAHITLKKLSEDSVDVNIKRLGFSEQSGLELSNLALRLQAGRQSALLRNFRLEMPSTNIAIDTIRATYKMEGDKLLTASLNYNGSITNTYVTPSDLRCFHAPLKNIQKAINLQTTVTGHGTVITIPELNLWSETGDIKLSASGGIDTSQDKPSWSAKVDELTLSESIIDFLQKNIPDIPKQLANIGNLRLAGNINGASDGGLSAQTLIQTGIGDVDLDFIMSGTKQFKGTIDTEGLDLRQLLDNEQLGLLAANLSLDGTLSGKTPSVNAQGLISRLDHNDYPFSNIGINGSYSATGVAGFLKIEDPNLSASLEGNMENQNDGMHKINVKGQLTHLAPKALKLSDKWDDAVFSANIDADLTAKTINDTQGSLRISNFSKKETNGDRYNIDNLYLTSGYEDQIHSITMVSDFAKADLKGEFEYATLPQSIINFVGSALPTLPGLPPASRKSDNDFSLRLQVFKTDWLQKLFGMDIHITQPLTLDARVNDQTKTINLESTIPDITYNGSRYTNGNILITTPSDTIKGDLSLNKIMDNGQTIDLALKAVATNNNLTTSLSWDNKMKATDRLSGNLNMVTSLYMNKSAQPEAHVKVQPSHLFLNGTMWNVESSDIIYSADNLYVHQFTIHNGQQHVIIDGRASPYRQDSVYVDLNEVEVAYILDLVNFHSVEFSGKASGKATVQAPFGNFVMNADLVVDDFKFENGRMGTLFAEAYWSQETGQIDIDAVADDGPNAKTFVNGYVSPERNTIDLAISADGTYLDFAHNFTKTFLSSISGNGHGDLRLAGTLDNINLTGQLVIDEGQASVTALNTTYTLLNDTVNFIPDEIEFMQMPLYDTDGNRGTLSGGIHHKHLTSMTYDLFVNADNLLSYDFREFGESLFYGTVYASGDVAIHGRSGEVVIDCNVTPRQNTVFVYNASSPDAISNQEFIEWGSGSEKSGQLTVDSYDYTQEEIDISTDIYINFLVNCTPDATMRILMDANTNDYITLNGEGTIRATFHNKGPFNMFGTYTVDHGTYGVTIQNIIKKNFTFNRGGTIVFGGDPYNAALNLQALYTVNGVSLSDLNIGNSFASNTIRVNCLMNIGGMPNSPQVDFDLEMPTVNADEQQMVRSVINGQQEMNQQVLYLLGIGRFYNQGRNNSSTDQSDRTTLAMQSFLSGTISTQINTLLSSVIKNDNWNFGANISTGNEGWHNAEYEGLISGKMLNNRLLLNGQFGYRDNARQATPSFIGDFDVQYLLFPNGNLALKVYNQTNDRYFTKSSLNTQGIGVIMKKDFNGLRELFSTRKRKKIEKVKN